MPLFAEQHAEGGGGRYGWVIRSEGLIILLRTVQGTVFEAGTIHGVTGLGTRLRDFVNFGFDFCQIMVY